MKLYTFAPAPNPQRLKFFIDFKGLEIDTHQIDFPEGEQRTDSYKAIIPTGTVPALVLDSRPRGVVWALLGQLPSAVCCRSGRASLLCACRTLPLRRHCRR